MTGINVIVPLGGLGARFQKEGYLTRPKPFIPVLGKPMILWVLDNLTLGVHDTLVIVYNPAFMNIGRLMEQVVGHAYPQCQFVELPGPTRGAAETVLFGLRALSDDLRRRPTVLADGDTFYTTNVVGAFRQVAETSNAIFCFQDEQTNPIYSYIRVGDNDLVLEVKEKVKISDLANSGCYCFRNGTQLASECEALLSVNSTQPSQDGVGEFYTSGVIAAMISKGEPFKALRIEVKDIHVLGTPQQVEEFCRSWPSPLKTRFVFDLEGVLVQGSNLIRRNVEVLKRLKEQNHTIIINSTRPWGMEPKTGEYLEELGIPYDELVLGKPRGHIYVAGPKSVDAVVGDLDKQIGFHPSQAKGLVLPRPRLRHSVVQKVGAVHPAAVGFSVVVKVLDDPVRVGGGTYYEVICGDETGKITLSLKENQLTGLTVDKVIVVRNGRVKIVNGFLRLIVDRHGQLDLNANGATIEQIGSLDLSGIEYELSEVP